ncbi:MAG: hypothetical protein HY294_09950 [Candidatus Rokubacteria bacterium]|nr:hypothetical protein [Candidatus Rokubacteria bacterium]
MSRRALLRLAAGAAAALAAGPGIARPRRAGAATTPIEHLVIILRENHSYDNYFGAFPGGDGKTVGARCLDENPDPPHLREHALRGVVVGGNGYCHYREEAVPNYWAYARAFTLCDNYFGEVRGPSVPNYVMLMAAQTPMLDNPPRGSGRLEIPAITDRLDERGVEWANYSGGIFMVSMFKNAFASGRIRPEFAFDAAAAAGRLPAVTWLTPSLGDSEHPPASVRRGENWTVARINALMQGPQWPRCAVLVVWDEWGGFWDHVKPPVVEKEPGFFGQAVRYGYRIPCLVIGPHARRGHVSHTLYSHVSVLRTIERLFDVKPLTERDASANDLLDCFDFRQEPRAPLVLPLRT